MKSPSAAAQIIIALIPIIGIMMGALVIFFYLYWNHKQKMLMIEKNMLTQKTFDYSFFCLLSGFVLTGVGLALSFFFYVKEGIDYTLLSGLMPLSVGVSLLFFSVTQKRLDNNG